jgi:hypothetical protein
MTKQGIWLYVLGYLSLGFNFVRSTSPRARRHGFPYQYTFNGLRTC